MKNNVRFANWNPYINIRNWIEVQRTRGTSRRTAATSAHNDKRAARIEVPEWTQLRLWVKSGGHCEFNGCNADLYTERLTLKPDKLANVAHIVAASVNGPRGDDPLPLEERNNFENLMLVCLEHHSHFDKRYVKDYPAEVLRKWKREHEERVDWLLSLPPNLKTKIIRLRSKIGDETASISENDYRQAILPRYPMDKDGIEIDLTSIPETGDVSYWEICAKATRQKISAIHEASVAGQVVEHVSVFGFAPIPLLMYLGRALGNKIPASFFQRHRDTQKWSWKETAETPAEYRVEKVQEGVQSNSAIVVFSLSGTVAIERIPADLRRGQDIYLLTLKGQSPNTGFLNTADDLERFRAAYQQLLADIRAAKPQLEELHCFPAIPIPVALCCGRELLEKAHPTLLVYDYNKKNGEFKFALRVN